MLLGACHQSAADPPASTKANISDHRESDVIAQSQPLVSGAASLSCDYDYQGRTDRILNSINSDEIRKLVRDCVNAGRNMVHLYYKGAIGSDLKPLLLALHQVLSDEGIRTRIFEIDSSGGDVDATMATGEELSNGNWAVWVNREARCYSACVLLLAAGTHRSISGQVGIHRMLNPKSRARTPAELQVELESRLNAVKNYLTRYGANPALADLMMTIPSREIRVLSQAELDHFGLNGKNSVKADLARLDVARRCGDDFVQRWDEYGQAIKSCSMSGKQGLEDKRNFVACMNRIHDRLGFPDSKCPNDGPLRLPAP